MSYNLTPITAKIQKTTKGGITQPLLNVGAPVKMKAPASAPVKQSRRGGDRTKAVTSSGFAGDTPYTVSGGKGTIHGPKSSYDDAYKKRNKKVYGEMSKSQFIKESKRQTKVFKETGKWDAPKAKRTKAVTVSVITPTSVKPTKTVSIEAKINPAELKPKVTKVNTKKADPSKREVRKTRKINKKLAQAAEARAKGNEKKALRKEKAAMRKAARLAKKNK